MLIIENAKNNAKILSNMQLKACVEIDKKKTNYLCEKTKKYQKIKKELCNASKK